MIFASKTPRDLNHDPKPHINGHGNRQDHAFVGQCCTTRYEPRAFYDHVQHNQPNPLLTDYRLDIAHTTWNERDPRDWLADVTEHWPGIVLPFTLEQIDHARRVLTRLANLGNAPGRLK